MMINRCGGVISGSRKVEDNKSHRESIFHRQWWSTSTMTTHPIHYWQCRQGESTQSAQDRFGPLQRKDWWRLRSTWCSNTHVLLTSSPSDRMQAPQQLFDIVVRIHPMIEPINTDTDERDHTTPSRDTCFILIWFWFWMRTWRNMKLNIIG